MVVVQFLTKINYVNATYRMFRKLSVYAEVTTR